MQLRQHIIVLFGVVVLTFTIDFQTSFAQDHSSKSSKTKGNSSDRLVKQMERLTAAKERYASARERAVLEVTKQFDGLLDEIERSKLGDSEKSDLSRHLRSARSAFVSDGSFEKIPVMQRVYADYFITIRNEYRKLQRVYHASLKLIPASDSRRQKLHSEMTDYGQQIEKYDSLKVGQKWVGYRSDFDWGNRRVVPKGGWLGGLPVFLKWIDNSQVNVDFTFTIDRRDGENFEGTITQKGGKFSAVVAGTYDGTNLNMKMVRMKQGPERYFEYSGVLIGNFGQLYLKGRKADGAPTSGIVTLETK